VILIEDFDDTVDSEFLYNNIRPYFRDIFMDVALRSHSPRKGEQNQNLPFIDNVAFFEFTKLPGIICDRFYSTFEQSKDGFIY
jgi:hypothetical protein